ncbi:DUF551 domain-containing protein [Leclercia adecarboxylata]|uniref:DUF551 domain-containing protein n=1 Tax=Leclercia adecarboxylata TaxID=83655 RepID=A0ABU6I322_9ENTR|nr:DUF551 domain-containing protein [Leclercia adecarboxylata]MDH0062560.1 DUF551 domain-containing protein [Leclercia adecarboxylata]MEC3900706.1 DUF551 domain-containing protein [Leclercia adecarboxylata]MEC3935946.1 DUF551 domain-containing protein [Leclercia adecarboxylata]
MTFTKERLQEIVEDGFLKHGESKELARMALAALTAEKVILYREVNPYNGMTTGWMELTEQKYEFVKDNASANAEFLTRYTAQPAPVVPDALYQFAEFMAAESIKSGDYPDGWQCKASNAAHEYAQSCRAAMLQGAEPVQGWVPCSERMPVENDIVLVVDDGYFVCEAQYRDGDFYSAVRGKGEFFETTCRDVELWQPMPAAPQQEA